MDVPAVLLVTRSPRLVEEVGRLAAAAGATVRVVDEVADAAAQWASTPLVLLDPDAVGAGVPRRRPGLLLVAVHTRPDPPSGHLWQVAVAVGAEAVVVLPADANALLERLGAGEQPERTGRVVAVVGGSGGIGASVLAAAVTTVAAADRRVLLLDADPLGGGADLLLGAEDSPGLRWEDLLGTRGVLRPSVLRDGLPVARSGARVLTWSTRSAGPPAVPGPDAVAAVLGAATRACDLVVVDLPRHLDPATEAVLWHTDLLVLLVRVELRPLLAAAAVHDGLRPRVADLRTVLVRSPGTDLVDADAAEALGAPLLARLGHESGLVADLVRGEAPGSRRRGSLARAARAVIEAVDVTGAVPGATAGPARRRQRADRTGGHGRTTAVA